MPKHKRCSIDLRILFQELDFALDRADFNRSEDLCDELIEVADEIYKEEEKGEEKSQERIPKIRQ